MACISGKYITHLAVSFNENEEKDLQAQGYMKIYADLNKGAGGKFIYLWYKKEDGASPITRVQVTFNDAMGVGLTNAGYTKIHKDLNAGAEGDYIFLWYYRGGSEYDTPIVEIDVTIDPESDSMKFASGWERVACDLNRKTGKNRIYAWVKRESQTYICDVTATDSYGSDTSLFQAGYIRVDEDTNRGADGAYVYIWYRQTTDCERALSDLQISTNYSESELLQKQNYKQVCVDLNNGTGAGPVHLWYKQDTSVKSITVLLNSDALQCYEKAGVNVIKRDLNTGNKGLTEYLCVKQ